MAFVALIKKHRPAGIIALGILIVSATFGILAVGISQRPTAQADSRRLVTVYDRGMKNSFLSDAKTLKDALNENNMHVDPQDTVEPSLEEELVAPEYKVNIYRARPVVVVDGGTRVKVVSPYQTAQRIADDAGIELFVEDETVVTRSTDYVSDGAGLQLTIDRATPMILDLYGRKTDIRTQGETVQQMLEEKEIVLEQNDRVSVDPSSKISQGMQVRVWREGKQVITIDEPIPFETERIFDADRPVGYRAISSEGINGVQNVHYEVEIKDGVELSRTRIHQIVTKQPAKQIEIIGIKTGPNALTKSKGAQIFVDSRGVAHRETYYDLPMNVVMRACGQGGYYTVRADGVKVDRDGYALIAANYGNYPRCSIVETSVGPGKVYDTGGFALRHPHGFDIATDWTNNNGI